MKKSRRGFLGALAAIPAAIALPAVAAPRNPTVVALENTTKFTDIVEEVRRNLNNPSTEQLQREVEIMKSFGRGQTKALYHIDELAYFPVDQDGIIVDQEAMKKFSFQLYGPVPKHRHSDASIIAVKHIDYGRSVEMIQENMAYDRTRWLRNA